MSQPSGGVTMVTFGDEQLPALREWLASRGECLIAVETAAMGEDGPEGMDGPDSEPWTTYVVANHQQALDAGWPIA